MAKSINDVSWSMFLECLEYFCQKNDRKLIAVNRSTKPTQRSESLVILSGSSTTGLNGKPFIPWSKTSGITLP
ncbi:MAG: hypothetical protein F6K18_00720 [Okeania sp. SIO2C2]|uniref:hypothetical protein n=1 Tax=Okeania sp. SIO2C2 TaxID=2607787 RepID=UPI0013B8710B|nr:hypothetical protein [Okeania sp. SIO2C2]NEP85463.1 hypothetical protein [Okeania sp. SIO2C2]